MKLFKEPLRPLPTSVQELDVFVATIIKTHNLPDTDDTYESIATLIMHMPQSASAAPYSFFADSVNKSRANAAAYEKLREFSRKRAEKEAQASAPASNQVDPQKNESTGEQPVQDASVQKTSE